MDLMTVTPLGSGQEVGRSCHVLEFRGMKVMLDIGIHPGYDGLNGLPFLDKVELDQIDVLLVTHFHLDHAASLPYLTERTVFKGRIFMTHPTKAVLRLLLGDYLRLLQARNSEDALYTEADLNSCMNKIELIDYHENVSVKGMNFHALNAGHVLGACMYWIELGGRSILYTGDYSREDDRHLMAAEIPARNPDVLIVESTYGVQVHATRTEREARFTGTIERVVKRGGRCLIPVFALGRAQELLLILDEYWQANPQLHDIPIWYASKLASKALRVYQTYSNLMNTRIRAQMNTSNPFRFNHIQNLKSIDVNSFDDSGPAVVFASPGMLQSGVSRQLFDRWATDKKNGVLIAGYAVEHTLAKEIMSQPKEVVTLEGRRQPLNCLVAYVSFSAHVDFVQNSDFISKVAPKNIILVHGQKDEMGRLKSSLMHKYRSYSLNERPTISMPPNQVEVNLKFKRILSAKVMGKLAEKTPRGGDAVQGVIVTHNFQSKIVAPEDVPTFTPLRVGSITSKLHVPFAGSVETLKFFLCEMFTGITDEELSDDDGAKGRLLTLPGGVVALTVGKQRGIVFVEWEASPANDVLADSVIALIMHSQGSAASVRFTSQKCNHGKPDIVSSDSKRARKYEGELLESRVSLFDSMLKERFARVDTLREGRKVSFEVACTDLQSEPTDGVFLVVHVEFIDDYASNALISVECKDESIAKDVERMLQGAASALSPISSNAFV